MLALNVSTVPAHIEERSGVMEIDGCTLAVTCTVSPFEVAVGALAQVLLLLIWQVTTSLFPNDEVVKLSVVIELLTPFIYHSKPGLLPPPLVVLWNVTSVPAHTAPAGLAVIVMAGVTELLTVMVRYADAVSGSAQADELLIIQDTTSPLTSAELLY